MIRNSNPIDIRKLVFQESAKNNIAISDEKRNMILKKISNKLDTRYQNNRKNQCGLI